MFRQAPFPVFCILLWFTFANDVESLSTLRDQCLEFDIADLEEYVSTLNFANVPTVETMFAGFECPITALPFGFLRSDWARLLLLRKVLAEESIFTEKLERLIRVLIIAYQRIERSLVQNESFNKTKDGHSVITIGLVLNTTTEDFGNMKNNSISYEDSKTLAGKELENKQKKVLERISTRSSMNDLNVTDFFENETVSFSTPRVNKVSQHTTITSKARKNLTDKNQNEKIVKKAKNEKDLVTFSKCSTPINFEVPSMVNSRSTVKLDRFETSTEKFNSIDSLSTVRTEIFEETTSQGEETKRTTGNAINFHDSGDEGNRNIEDDRNFTFTTLPSGCSVNMGTSANGRTDFNSFDTDREKIKNDEKLKVSPFASVDTVTMSLEKSEKSSATFFKNTPIEASTSSTINFDSFNKTAKSNDCSNSLQSTESYADTISSTTSENILSRNQNFTSSESANTDGNIKANVDSSFVASTKASTSSDPTRSTINDVTNRRDLKETTSNEVSISEKDNPGNTSSVAKNSIDYLDLSLNGIYDVLAHESNKPDSDIDGHHRVTGNKLKKFPVSRKQPPKTITNVYEETVQKFSTPPSHAATLFSNSIEGRNEFKETTLGSRKRDDTNTNIENNFRFFYNYGGRLAAGKKMRDDLNFIRVRCKEEST